MSRLDQHLTNRELLEFADGELAATRAESVRLHLAACWACRTRSAELEATISRFVQWKQSGSDPRIPPPEGPRALLRARLAAEASQVSQGQQRTDSQGWARAVAGIAALAIFVLGLTVFFQRHASFGAFDSASQAEAVPDRGLTPGAVRPVRLQDVCSEGQSDKNRAVPVIVQQQVFQKYGLNRARAADFEVDYLITPELGGSDDIRNLWPEPYTSTAWTASVKDALEDRLHELVCQGHVDLYTAQREISTDWIAAYKKYFHTEKPLLQHAATPSPPAQSLDQPEDSAQPQARTKVSTAS